MVLTNLYVPPKESPTKKKRIKIILVAFFGSNSMVSPRNCLARANSQYWILRNYFEAFTAANLICCPIGIESGDSCITTPSRILRSVNETSWPYIVQLLSHGPRTLLIYRCRLYSIPSSQRSHQECNSAAIPDIRRRVTSVLRSVK